MRMATSEEIILGEALAAEGLKVIKARGIRPAVGFNDPLDVLKDPHLSYEAKREILSSWASDASAVRDEPRLRWLLGTVEPVPLDDVLEAMARLDRIARQ